MRKTALLAMLLILVLGYKEASGADWKYFGGATLPKKELVIAYYDDESIEYLPAGNVRVWTKSVSPSEIGKMAQKKEVIEKAAKKVVQAYFPPYCLLNPYPKTSYDDYMNIIGWEEAANHDEIKPRARILFEIDCKEKMIRTLSTTIYENKGGVTLVQKQILRYSKRFYAKIKSDSTLREREKINEES
ncbi:MAG: hypothetical protein ABSC54_10370 [Smithellaceae bacterium]|jgi:hypothetical protein